MMRRILPIVVAVVAAGLPVGSAQTSAPADNPVAPAQPAAEPQQPNAPTNELSAELLGKLQTAAQHAKANQPREAIALYTEFLTARADIFSPYVERGKLYLVTKEYSKSADDFTTALKLKSDLADAYMHRCMAYYELADYPKAIADCNKYVSTAPRTLGYEPFYYKGMAHARLGQNDLAVAELSKAFELKSDLPDAHMFLGQLYLNQDQLLNALREFTVVIQQRPGDKEALKHRSAIKASLGDEIGAKEDLAKAR
jgi:tetratricopeptide (TPR) repeat protein